MTQKKTARAGFDLGRWLVYGAAAFQAYHMGRAFHVYDPHGWHFMNVNLGGLILGAIVNVIVAQAATRLPDISATFASLKQLIPKVSKKADKREEAAYSRAFKKMTLAKMQNFYSLVGFVSLLLISALMVAPALFILWGASMSFPKLFIGILVTVGALAPDVAITVGGFIASSGSANRSTSEPTGSDSLSGKSGGSTIRSAGGSRRSANGAKRKAVAGAVYVCPHAGAGCDVTKGTQEAINAHAGRCKFKPTISMPADVPNQNVER